MNPFLLQRVSSNQEKEREEAEAAKRSRWRRFKQCLKQGNEGAKSKNSNITLLSKAERQQIAVAGWKKVKKIAIAVEFMAANGEELDEAMESALYGQSRVGLARKSMITNSLPSFLRDENQRHATNIIYPDSNFYLNFRIFISFLLVYNAFVIPYRLANYWWYEHGEPFFLLESIAEVFFLIHLVMHFFTAYAKDIVFITDKRRIAKKYLTGFFFVDFVSILPLYEIHKYFIAIKLLRLARLPQIFTLGDSLGIKMKFFHIPVHVKAFLSRLFKWMMILIYCGHLFACLWILISRIYIDDKDSWLNRRGLQDEHIYYQYTDAVYFVVTTFSTVGYGEIKPIIYSEKLFTMVMEFIGIALFAYLMGNINSVISNYKPKAVQIKEKEEELGTWIIRLDRYSNTGRRIPGTLVQSLQVFFQGFWTKDCQQVTKSRKPFLAQMPLSMRSRLMDYVFEDFFRDFSTFFSCVHKEETQFLYELVKTMYPQSFPRGTPIIPVGAPTRSLYLISRGTVTLAAEELVCTFAEIPENSYFGEGLIFTNSKATHFGYYASPLYKGDVECMCVDRSHFIEVCRKFPKTASKLKSIAMLRERQFRQIFKTVTRLAWQAVAASPSESVHMEGNIFQDQRFQERKTDFNNELLRRRGRLNTVITATASENFLTPFIAAQARKSMSIGEDDHQTEQQDSAMATNRESGTQPKSTIATEGDIDEGDSLLDASKPTSNQGIISPRFGQRYFQANSKGATSPEAEKKKKEESESQRTSLKKKRTSLSSHKTIEMTDSVPKRKPRPYYKTLSVMQHSNLAFTQDSAKEATTLKNTKTHDRDGISALLKTGQADSLLLSPLSSFESNGIESNRHHRMFSKQDDHLNESEVYTESSLDQKYNTSGLFNFKQLRDDSLLPSDEDLDVDEEEPLFNQYDKIMDVVSQNLQKLSSAVRTYQDRAHRDLRELRYAQFAHEEDEQDSALLDPALVILEDDDFLQEEDFPSQNASSELRTVLENQGKGSTLS